jgi:cobalt-precorrin 5A hydrolase/precorrin-3B C17-methyltransferase
VALSPHILDFPSLGRARGRLSVVGLGPGTPDWRSPQARRLLMEATDWVGYGLYLDLVEKYAPGKAQHRFPLGAEEARVRHALELAGAGRDVALISSGDPGIYAMAALAFELLDPETSPPLSEGARRVAIEVAPGISAFQAAAARAGAPFGHDFCLISLSDLLTPWAAIEKRLHAAAEGDFAVAFYNPRSLRRTEHLSKALEILKSHRPGDTPVIVASNLGRPKETLVITPLRDFDPEVVDMLTIVIVGSSATRAFTRGDGRTHAYTPRGYAAKRER